MSDFNQVIEKMDWFEINNRRKELIVLNAKHPSDNLITSINLIETFQREFVILLGSAVVFPGFEFPDMFVDDVAFCKTMINDKGRIYCPYCLSNFFYPEGIPNNQHYDYRCLRCRHCEKSFAIRYNNPTPISIEEMKLDIEEMNGKVNEDDFNNIDKLSIKEMGACLLDIYKFLLKYKNKKRRE